MLRQKWIVVPEDGGVCSQWRPSETQWSEGDQTYLKLLETEKVASDGKGAFSTLVQLFENASSIQESTQVDTIAANSLRRRSQDIYYPFVGAGENNNALITNIEEPVLRSEHSGNGKDQCDRSDSPLNPRTGRDLLGKKPSSPNAADKMKDECHQDESSHLSVSEGRKTWDTYSEAFYATDDADDTKHASGNEETRSRNEADRKKKVDRIKDNGQGFNSEKRSEERSEKHSKRHSRKHSEKISGYDNEEEHTSLYSLDGRQLAGAFGRGNLFLSCNPTTQVAMIQKVLGTGPMEGDVTWIGGQGQELLDPLLKKLNAHVKPPCHIKRKDWLDCNVSDSLKSAVRQSCPRVTDQDRWECFSLALSMRNQRSCGKILQSRVFDSIRDRLARKAYRLFGNNDE
ncbi:hypothetical protein NX059_011034 [Plenodomus lindquistii]|nr:hypothetical protein NX059_011034 [Plenodomus lindquistii]